ncbi:MAG: GrpB family protein [Oscillatoriales cyanobacterium C42_A2020_001]|nr:GrpB family protein [Leptolyngbyaceae cyanobacterium C42_A2020_001]
MPRLSKVEMVPHDPQWRHAFEAEAKRVAVAIGQNVVAIHHIGSTAIPGIYAKPIIDLLVEVDDITLVDACNSTMQALGYEVVGEFGIPGRRFFSKDNAAGDRTHHVHAFQTNSPQVERNLAFRDFLIAHPHYAQTYSELKQKLAKQYPNDIEGYGDGKAAFIEAMHAKAQAWRMQSGG